MRLVQQSLQFPLISPKDILFAAGEVGMDLTWQERILRDVGLSGVFVQGEQEEPDHADDDAEEGQHVRQPDEKEVRFVPQIADRGWYCLSVYQSLCVLQAVCSGGEMLGRGLDRHSHFNAIVRGPSGECLTLRDGEPVN